VVISRDLVAKYLVSVFVDVGHVVGEREATIRLLAPVLVDFEMHLVPLNLEGMSFEEMPAEVLAKIPLVIFQSSDSTRQLVVQSGRVNYAIEGMFEKSDLPSWADFIAEAVPRLSAVLDAMGIAGNRLAFVAEELATDRVQRVASTGEVAARLLTIPRGVDPASLTEWQWRAPYRRDHGSERYNVLPRVVHASGLDDGQRWDGIRFEFDANTYQGNDEERFASENLEEAFEALLQVANDQDEIVSEAAGDF
jgi:hypothetical protein